MRDVTIDGCTIDGGVTLTQCESARVSRTEVRGASVAIMAGRACTVEQSVVGGLRWGVGVQIDGGDDHRVADTTVHDSLAGIRVTGTNRTKLEANAVTARWWGIHVVDADETAIARNRVHDTMRAFTVTGARTTHLVGNVATDCDSALLLEVGADGTEVTEHLAEDCRVGMHLWAHTATAIVSVQLDGCRDADVIESEAAS